MFWKGLTVHDILDWESYKCGVNGGGEQFIVYFVTFVENIWYCVQIVNNEIFGIVIQHFSPPQK